MTNTIIMSSTKLRKFITVTLIVVLAAIPVISSAMSLKDLKSIRSKQLKNIQTTFDTSKQAAEDNYSKSLKIGTKQLTKKGDLDGVIAYWVKRRSYPPPEQYRKLGQVDITFRMGTCITMMVDAGSKELKFLVTNSINRKDELRLPTALDTWEFWTGTFVAGGDMVLYKNGAQGAKTAVTVPSVLNPNESNRIGWKSWNASTSQFHPDHCIDEVMVFNRCLSASEVKTLYSALR